MEAQIVEKGKVITAVKHPVLKQTLWLGEGPAVLICDGIKKECFLGLGVALVFLLSYHNSQLFLATIDFY